MVKHMKSSENKLLSPAARDERLGTVLANGLEEMETGACLEVEEIAALVDGSVTIGGGKRDTMLKHLASCDTCHEIFLLSTDLREEETEKEIKGDRSKIALFKPLALAASLLIAILSIYIFYKSGEIPKTAEQLVVTGEAKKKAPRKAGPPPAAPVTFSKKGLKTGEKKANQPATRLKRIEKKRKAEEKISKDKEAVTGVEKDAPADELRDRVGTLPPPVSARRKTSQMPRSQKLEAVPAEVEKEEESLYHRQQVIEGVKAQQQKHVQAKPAALNETETETETAARGRETYLPARQLQTLFNEAIQKTRQSKKAFKDAGKKRLEGNDFSGEDSGYIFPGIKFFLSKSKPGTIPYRFFNLARSGWCDADGLWYGKEAAVGAAEFGRDGKKLLELWLTLYPELNGIFREIAGHTINRLKQKRR